MTRAHYQAGDLVRLDRGKHGLHYGIVREVESAFVVVSLAEDCGLTTDGALTHTRWFPNSLEYIGRVMDYSDDESSEDRIH